RPGLCYYPDGFGFFVNHLGLWNRIQIDWSDSGWNPGHLNDWDLPGKHCQVGGLLNEIYQNQSLSVMPRDYSSGEGASLDQKKNRQRLGFCPQAFSAVSRKGHRKPAA
ncbi:MAG: hypothetical protein GXP30_04795, partial [Verrucomicrobia bacterium]|nr:hypothetical protein [Verrucomicrobiota bacterium]